MEFKGMALYNIDEIRSALEEYRTSINEVKAIIRGKVAQAELDWKPSRWQKLWGIKTLEQYWKSDTMWRGYWSFICTESLITFKEYEWEMLRYVDGDYFTMRLDNWLTEYNQIKSLFKGGKECYLNPNQAAFVNKFKKEVNND
jgi:hypothetical protein